MSSRQRLPDDPDANDGDGTDVEHEGDLAFTRDVLSGDARAVRSFRDIVAQEVTLLLPRFKRAPHEDDVVQRVVERLILPDPEGRTRLEEYRGVGALRSWIRVVAARLLLNASTREMREQPAPESLFGALTDGASSIEAALVKTQCRELFARSLEAAMSALSARDRVLLTYTYRDGLTLERIGEIYGVHTSTASRWVERARRGLLVFVREHLERELKLTDSVAASFVRDALSQLDLTLSRIFPTGDAETP